MEYLITREFNIALSVCICTATAAFISSTTTKNYSFVDRMWSITPWIYCWIFASKSWDIRSTTMASLATIWGLRLTYNFYRKGGYNPGEQDYRWPILEQIITTRAGNFAWIIFNIFFISIFQNLLLFLIAIPCHISAISSDIKWMATDSLFMGLFVFFLCIETLADQEQWEFQTLKYKLVQKHGSIAKIPAPYNVGFIQTGLWKYSRHPNFFAEQMIWWSFFGMSLSPAISMNSSIYVASVGATLLSLLFLGSYRFSEYISAKKYPLYAEYQKRVYAYIGPPCQSMITKEAEK